MSLTVCRALASALPRALCSQDAWCSAVSAEVLTQAPAPPSLEWPQQSRMGWNSVLRVTRTPALESALPPQSLAWSQHASLVGSLLPLASLFIGRLQALLPPLRHSYASFKAPNSSLFPYSVFLALMPR